MQWNLSNPDTNGAEESVIVSEVSSFQRLKCMQERYLGWEKVSSFEECPYRGVPLYLNLNASKRRYARFQSYEAKKESTANAESQTTRQVHVTESIFRRKCAYF